MNTVSVPIWRDGVDMFVAIEVAVRHFSRYHKYTLGTELRRQGMKICQLVNRAEWGWIK